MKPRIKICGLRHPANVREVLHLKPDFIGLIFYEKSPRYAGHTDPRQLPSAAHTTRVGVFVNQTLGEVAQRTQQYGLGALQLHGDEDVAYLHALRQKTSAAIIKVFHTGTDLPFREMEPFTACADYFLFDTATPNYGGSGLQFNWSLLKHYPHKTPYFLSGGIAPHDIGRIAGMELPGLFAVDLNSKVETAPGMKNVQLIKEALKWK